MPKRLRESEQEERSVKKQSVDISENDVNGASLDGKQPPAAVASTCSANFTAYIHSWMSEANGDRRPTTAASSLSLPAIAPLPTILDLMMTPPAVSSVVKSADATANAAPAVQEGVRREAEGTGVVYDEVMLQHASTDPGEYERPGRLLRLLDHLRAIGLLACCRRIPRRVARTKELRLVHTPEHIDNVDQLEFVAALRSPESSCSVGQDLYANTSTPKAARAAAGCVIAAALSVVRGEVCNAFALVRPPGHHASANAASGFCFFNNVAVAVRVAQQELRQRGVLAPRALVLDWDVHHCDGTESIFYEDPSVVVVSVHQYYGRGRGHVLRKTPSAFHDTIDLSSLAALMDMAAVEKTNNNGADAHDGNSGNEASFTKDTRESDHPLSSLDKEEEEEKEKKTRSRKPVDYAKLASDLNGEENNDEAIAMMFGVAPEDLKDSSSASSSSDGSSSSSHSSFSTVPENIPGDTEGLSFDEEVDTSSNNLFYPGTGHIDSVGGDVKPEARGKNINVPWPTVGMGDLEYMQVFFDIVAPVMREYKPDIVFLSCGFDSAAGDLLGSMHLSVSGYYLLTKALAALCPRLVVALEGGYHLANVARCSEAVTRALLESGGTSPLPRSGMLWCQVEELVKQVRRTHEGHWRCFSGAE